MTYDYTSEEHKLMLSEAGKDTRFQKGNKMGKLGRGIPKIRNPLENLATKGIHPDFKDLRHYDVKLMVKAAFAMSRSDTETIIKRSKTEDYPAIFVAILMIIQSTIQSGSVPDFKYIMEFLFGEDGTDDSPLDALF